MASGYGYVEKAAGIEALVLAIDGAVGLAAANQVPDGVVIDLRDHVPSTGRPTADITVRVAAAGRRTRAPAAIRRPAGPRARGPC